MPVGKTADYRKCLNYFHALTNVTLTATRKGTITLQLRGLNHFMPCVYLMMEAGLISAGCEGGGGGGVSWDRPYIRSPERLSSSFIWEYGKAAKEKGPSSCSMYICLKQFKRKRIINSMFVLVCQSLCSLPGSQWPNVFKQHTPVVMVSCMTVASFFLFIFHVFFCQLGPQGQFLPLLFAIVRDSRNLLRFCRTIDVLQLREKKTQHNRSVI